MGRSPGDDLLGVRATGHYGPQWTEVRRLVDRAARAHARRRLGRAEALLDAAHRGTLAPDADAGGLDLRARALCNLAGVVADRGRPGEALALFERALAACAEVERAAGDEYGTAAVRCAALVNRAQTLTSLGRAPQALADLAAAERAAGGAAHPLLSFQLRNSRGNALLAAERLAEAEVEFRRALDIALDREPRLAGEAYAGLAALAARTGDRTGAEENLLLAGELRAAAGDDPAGVEEDLARLALRAGRAAEAGQRFTAALRRHERAGDVVGAARCRLGAAAVALRRARVRTADRLLADATTALERAGDVPVLVECRLLRGYVSSVTRGWADGERHFLAARELCAGSGAWHQAARVDFLRADVVASSARATLRRGERARRREAALGLALPAALAIEAFGHRFAPGPTRERWAGVVAAPALVLAFELITALGRSRLAFELVEHACAGVGPGPAPAAARAWPLDAVHDPFDLAPPAAPHAPPADPDPASAFGPPPRLRVVPSGESELAAHLDAAERHYHLAVRAADEVPAW
ncbi:hypothetical protein [Saccharothrix algeriensis]|uniref:Tetratricopeptide (TPR) repeat protein n=3 Tax=Saccharothrix algeriensis TaxID=173560 RepID=A0ABS2SFC5_9PSEU|nr:hypothetical protein [Saccharothrix algeriensis]MBM7814966.1 tetratricopeptide (TPR) repeat protein [Saccharothrix algeriensis]